MARKFRRSDRIRAERELLTQLPPKLLRIESIDLDGQGVAHGEDGKVVFVDGALPNEHVWVRPIKQKATFEKAQLLSIAVESSMRVTPQCPHFGLQDGACGGCKVQHLHPQGQLAVKQRALEDVLWHVGRVKPALILRPMAGPDWGYRYRSRLSARFVAKKNEVLVGFHERKSRYVANMPQCPVLPKAVSDVIPALKTMLLGMDAKDQIPQIEVACGDGGVIAMLVRHLVPLTPDDQARLIEFAKIHPGLQWWLQPGGNDTVHPMDAKAPPLVYRLPAFGITMPFKPTDFTQVNPFINDMLVSRALGLLAVAPTERVIDWFCGLGNFTLALASCAAHVLGVEGSETLVQRALDNYRLNNADGSSRKKPLAPTDFVARDLFEMTPEGLCADGSADKWLVDPPREGAFALVQALASALVAYRSGALARGFDWYPPKKIVYVSCNPATLARDAKVLVQAGYTCSAAGVVNMFPHTAHVESIAVFDLG